MKILTKEKNLQHQWALLNKKKRKNSSLFLKMRRFHLSLMIQLWYQLINKNCF